MTIALCFDTPADFEAAVSDALHNNEGRVSGIAAYFAAATEVGGVAAPEGEVVVTKNDQGQIVAVTRQDEDGRILSVIAESAVGGVAAGQMSKEPVAWLHANGSRTWTAADKQSALDAGFGQWWHVAQQFTTPLYLAASVPVAAALLPSDDAKDAARFRFLSDMEWVQFAGKAPKYGRWRVSNGRLGAQVDSIMLSAIPGAADKGEKS